MIASYFRAQLREISQSRALQFYGAGLAMIHVFTAFLWATTGPTEFLTGRSIRYCWPIFESCRAVSFDSPLTVTALLGAYGLLAAGDIALFYLGRVRQAYLLFLALFVFKFAFFTLDFRLQGNHHFFGFVISFLFLFVPQKRNVIPFMVLSFYLAASLLKFNREWLSGAAFNGFSQAFLRGRILEWACAYVILLECVLIWGLLAPRTSLLFWATLLQFLVFHLFSVPIVSWFYPSVMICLLQIFVLADSPIRPPKHRFALACLALFWILQLLPRLYPGDTALTTQGRFFALSMIETSPMCKGIMTARRGDQKEELLVPPMQLPVRIRCHPLVFYNWARNICRNSTWDDLDFFIAEKRASSDSWTTLMVAKNFCSDTRRYPLLAAIPWIKQ